MSSTTPRTRATISALMVFIERNRPIIFEHQRDDNTDFRRSRRRPLPGVIVVTAGKKTPLTIIKPALTDGHLQFSKISPETTGVFSRSVPGVSKRR